MGNSNLISSCSPLVCILKNWAAGGYDPLKNKMIFFCNIAWPQCSLDSGEMWPENGPLDYNTILQLELCCKREEKWDEWHSVCTIFHAVVAEQAGTEETMVQQGDKPPRFYQSVMSDRTTPQLTQLNLPKAPVRPPQGGAAGAPATQTSEPWALGSQAHEESVRVKRNSLCFSYPTGQGAKFGQGAAQIQAGQFPLRQVPTGEWNDLGTFPFSLLSTCLIGKIICQHIEMAPKEWKTCSPQFYYP